VSPGVIRLNVPWFVTGARFGHMHNHLRDSMRQEIIMGARGMI
jgi:hypothetical protein